MKTVFAKRRTAFHQRVLTYLPYAFNDHFVLVLLVGLGGLLYQYRQLLLNLPTRRFWLYGGLVLFALALLSLGRLATYLEEPDQHYLLVQEEAVLAEVAASYRRALAFWLPLQALLFALAYPLYQALGWGQLSFVLSLLLLTGAKVLVLFWRYRQSLTSTGLDWSRALLEEGGRQEGILRFFSLFTQVKGLMPRVHKRPYLNGLLPLLSAGQENLYGQLYWRAFLRAGDYLGLFVRLSGLALASLLAVPQAYLGAVLAGVFNALLLFQLLPLYHHYDYQPLLRLAPLGEGVKKAALLALVQRLSYFLLVLEIWASKSWQAALLLLAMTLFVAHSYLPHKIKAIDEVA